jgi:hypothetical protein
MPSKPQLYLYTAHGHALSCNVTRPFVDMVDAQAAASLSTRGGHGLSTVNNFNYKNLASFKSATSRVAGSEDADGNHTSVVSISVEALNIMDVVTADRIVARIACHHKPGDDEARIAISGSHFDNLKIAGTPVTVTIDHDLFRRIDTFDSALKEIDKNKNFKQKALDPFNTGKLLKKPAREGMLFCSCVNSLSSVPGTTQDGHWYVVPQFGTVYLGEVASQYQKRRLTMIRIELGSPMQGTVIALDGQGNGVPWP